VTISDTWWEDRL